MTLEVRRSPDDAGLGERASCDCGAWIGSGGFGQELARERFSILSSSSNLELTNALFSLARSRDNAIDALYRLNAARINLARALGKMGEIS